MSSGIRAEVAIDGPEGCPVARVSGERGLSTDSISRSTAPDAPGTVTEEFVLESADPVDDLDLDEDVSRVFSYGSKDVYRFTRSRGRGCPCERVERFDCPVVDVRTEDGSLHLVFHAPDVETLQGVIGELREGYPNLDVRRLLRSDGEYDEGSLVFVDRSELTDRQEEVLRTAHRMGYFEHPKDANAGEVAEELGITTSTFTEHLSAAQKKILGSILDP